MPYPMSPEEKSVNKKIGARLRALREGRNVTVEGMAYRLGVHPRTVGNIERGNHRIPVYKVVMYCKILESNPGDLFGV